MIDGGVDIWGHASAQYRPNAGPAASRSHPRDVVVEPEGIDVVDLGPDVAKSSVDIHRRGAAHAETIAERPVETGRANVEIRAIENAVLESRVVAIVLGEKVNVAFLVGLAFAVAASANLPAIIFSVFWKRFNTAGAVGSLVVGLGSSIALIMVSPVGIFGKEGAWFPLENPGIVSIPLGFLGAIVGTLLTKEPEAEAKFTELTVRANIGLGAEKASEH